VLGVGVSALSFDQACELIVGAHGQKKAGYICLCTANGLDEASRDEEFRRIFNNSWLTTPDGMPVVWLGPPGVERVYGPDLMLTVCDKGRTVGMRHFFYGGHPGVAVKLGERLSAKFPGLAIAGHYTPPFRELNKEELADLRDAVSRARPDIIWVGIGTPKQERFMAGIGSTLDTGLLIGVGAAFDFHSGRMPQAPRWMQRTGLEWFFRLCTEPRRLTGRYVVRNTKFVLRVAAQKLGIRDYPML
jgi:N-acetylglucosaminyldiphosphoundecaprenol N-acetyl-beta-D-mannosaminyltransferase